uniref:RanBP2-type domain-containing protein n=1 Tax=Callorhinchus milii TaxID=7868 RepID=A0A4W3GKG6_CALMI
MMFAETEGILSSLSGLSPAQRLPLACHPSGSHVLSAFLTSPTITASHRAQLSNSFSVSTCVCVCVCLRECVLVFHTLSLSLSHSLCLSVSLSVSLSFSHSLSLSVSLSLTLSVSVSLTLSFSLTVSLSVSHSLSLSVSLSVLSLSLSLTLSLCLSLSLSVSHSLSLSLTLSLCLSLSLRLSHSLSLSLIDQSWECGHCTYLNTKTGRICSMCHRTSVHTPSPGAERERETLGKGSTEIENEIKERKRQEEMRNEGQRLIQLIRVSDKHTLQAKHTVT